MKSLQEQASLPTSNIVLLHKMRGKGNRKITESAGKARRLKKYNYLCIFYFFGGSLESPWNNIFNFLRGVETRRKPRKNGAPEAIRTPDPQIRSGWPFTSSSITRDA
jgi:hypothetical protein